MKKKKIIILFLILICFFCLIFIVIIGKKQSCYSSYGTIGCIATDFKQIDSKSYLTIKYGNKNQEEKKLYVDKSELIHKIEINSLDNIIGVSISLEIPVDVLRKYNINTNSITFFDLMDNRNFDTYFVLDDIFLEDESVSEE